MNKTKTFFLALVAAAGISMYAAKDCNAQVYTLTPGGYVFGIESIINLPQMDNYIYNPPVIIPDPIITEPVGDTNAPYHIPEPAKPINHWQKAYLEGLLREK